MVNNNRNQKVYFPEEADKIITEILEKNNLKETIEEAVEKIVQKKDCLINIIYDASRDFAEGKISEKDFSTHLQKKMGASTQAAESLVKNIKEKLLPVAIRVNIGETEKIETEKTATTRPIRLISETQDINKKSVEVLKTAKKFPTAEEKKSEIIKEIRKQPKKQDSYLEPIE